MTGRRESISASREAWFTSSAVLVVLGAIVPLAFTDLSIKALGTGPVFLSLIITEWAAIRLTALLIKGEPRLVQATFWVFVYVWFGVTALAETVAQRFPIPGQPFTEGPQIRALLAIILGLAAYEFGLLGRHRASRVSALSNWLSRRQLVPQRLWWLGALGILGSLLAVQRLGLRVLFGSRYSAAVAVYGTPGAGQRLDQIGNKAVGVIESSLMWAPVFIALYLVVLSRRTSGDDGQGVPRSLRSTKATLLILALAVGNLLVNNPISAPRYRFGGVALALVAIVWSLRRAHRFRLWVCGLIAGILFVLPIADIFRYDERHLELTPLEEQLVDSPDFGMFQQEVNAQLWVDENGHTLGEQMAGVVFVFVPRVLWPDKPTDTGNMIVRSDAINASASLWAVAYVDGGWLGVALTLLAYGWLTGVFEELYLKRRPSIFIAAAVPLFAGFQIIVLRGDLQPAVGQLAPLLLMLLFASRGVAERRRGSNGGVRRHRVLVSSAGPI